jgi:hypothetical protein
MFSRTIEDLLETSQVNGWDGKESHRPHADLDAFYASVEQLLDPSLRRKPIAVVGVVLAAFYQGSLRAFRSASRSHV